MAKTEHYAVLNYQLFYLVFVDRHGDKVIEKFANEFVEELNDEKSKIIADHSIFNHALGQIINSIIR